MDSAVSDAWRAFYDARLADWSNRLQRLIDLPLSIALDPLRATDPESGQLLPEAVTRVADGMRRHVGLVVALPFRSDWTTGDLGPGLDRTELRALLNDIGTLRQALL